MTASAPSPYAKQARELQRQAVLTASPAALLVMLYDRLLADLARAHDHLAAGRRAEAGEQLSHAQEIIGALSTSLRPELWDGAENLQAIYTYVSSTLLRAGSTLDPALVAECTECLEPLRDAWAEAAAAGHGRG
ncbi:flagellar export chaperone FliS [Sinomonas halotolerans]|uniref:Flagellar export chaperone FliS n=1 Tax=Sinomonas halotolerans TaxID=1644133 RepID=A0ABU9WYU8_9MICC